jgi:protein phosphatase
MRIIDFKYIHEIGNKKKQEDSIWPEPSDVSSSTVCFIICDGVGGSENGEIASSHIAKFTGEMLTHAKKNEISLGFANIVLQKARQGLIEKADSLLLNHDMATTIAVIRFVDRRAFISWCGDSRIYHIRKGQILYRSSDHSLVNLLINRGEITEDEARRHPQKNVITKAIKIDNSDINADSTWIDNISNGDYFLLCSDGLLEMLTDGNIKEIFSLNNDRTDRILEIIREICAGNTRDNYSMYLIQVGEIESRSKNIWRISSYIFLIFFLIIVAVIYFSPTPKATNRLGTQPSAQQGQLDSFSLHGSAITNGNKDTFILNYELIKLEDGTIDTLWAPKESRKVIKDN